MPTFASLAILLSTFGYARAADVPSKPTPLKLQVPRGPYFVGQEILLGVGGLAKDEIGEARATVPKLTGAELVVLAPEAKTSEHQETANGDAPARRGNTLSLRLTPREVGYLVIPPIPIRVGDRRMVTQSLRMNILEIPSSSRPSVFTGGVGAFTLMAEAAPPQVRLGQFFEFRIRVQGAAARGMGRPPLTKKLENPALGFRITPLSAEYTADPPARVFRYRARAQKAGTLKLPPVAIAAFDPVARQFMTKTTPGVQVRVRDVPRLDPETLDYRLPDEPKKGYLSRSSVLILFSSLAVCMAIRPRAKRLLGHYWTKRSLRRQTETMQRLLDGTTDPSETARLISEGMVDYLSQTLGRPTGALTPEEAREGFTLIRDDVRLGEQAANLVSRCDRILFAEEGAELNGLVDTAKAFFQDLALQNKPRNLRTADPEKPREADETIAS